MNSELPKLIYADLKLTRDYLQDASKVLGKLQQAFIPKSPHDYQYGLVVTMRGLSTQSFQINGQPVTALLDLVRHKLRLGDQNFSLREFPPAELLDQVKDWLNSNNINVNLDEPKFNGSDLSYDNEQADNYAAALWWLQKQLSSVKDNIKNGTTSPILLYPHHFDLSLTHFNDDQTKQISLGFSSGDDNIAEPYLYLTSYPDEKIATTNLISKAHLQTNGFNGMVLLYTYLQKSVNPEKLFKNFTTILYK
jgi:hypothetical protein